MLVSCPCRKAQRNQKRQVTQKWNNDGYALKQLRINYQVDYTDLYPTFMSIFVRRFKDEREALLKLQSSLNQWAFCAGGACPVTSKWREEDMGNDEWSAWRGPESPLEKWSSRAMEGSKDIYIKVMTADGANMSKNGIRNTLTNKFGWKASHVPMWNVLWRLSGPRPEPSPLLIWQLAGRLKKAMWLGSKDLMTKAMKLCSGCADGDSELFEVTPKSFRVPEEFDSFVQTYDVWSRSSSHSNVWIYKPSDGAGGEGIRLLQNLYEAIDGRKAVVQQYLNKPLLIQGYKFDMRVYVLLTSTQPLEVFVCKQGIARYCKTKYTEDLNVPLAHLTNVHMQTMNPERGLLNGAEGSDFDKLRELLEAQMVPWDYLWGRIKSSILQMLTCMEYKLGVDRTFHYLGFDVLVDENLKPWILEVNTRPSLQTKLAWLRDLNENMIISCAKLLDPVPFDRYALAQIVERRLQEVDMSFDEDTATWQLNDDLNRVLRGRFPRKYGEIPDNLGLFDILAPSQEYNSLRQSIQTCPIVSAQDSSTEESDSDY